MGGGAMRTAAKSAAFAGYRSTSSRRPPTLPSAFSASSTVHVSNEGESVPLISSILSEKMVAVQRPVWELDDWEFANAGSDLVMDLDPKPRLVFGPAPSAEEAKEATKDLKEVINNIYFPGSAENSVKAGQVSGLGESTAILPSIPKPVIQAFSILQGSPEAQSSPNSENMRTALHQYIIEIASKKIRDGLRMSVVASLAYDPNIWEAFLKNDKVMEFYLRQRSVSLPKEVESETVGENESFRESSETVDSPCSEASETGSAFLTDFVQNIKVKVSKMVSSISGLLQDFIGASIDSHRAASPKTTTSSADNYGDVAFGASFIALALAAILVILVKRV